MASLVNLPNELLHYIFGEIERPTTLGQNVEPNNTPLLGLCLSCRQLKDVAQDILYRTVSHKVDKDGSLRPLLRLTDTILSEPRLADKVKTLSIQLNPQASVEIATVDAKLLSAFYQSITAPLWLQGAPQTLWTYEIVYALLSHLKNLETLHITVVGYDLKANQSQVSAKMVSRLPNLLQAQSNGWPRNCPLENLRKLEVEHYVVQAYIPLMYPGEIEVASLLSSVQSVCLRKRQSVSHPKAALLPPTVVTNLTNLELREYSINHSSLRTMCKLACNLKRFAFVTLDPLILHRGSLLGHPELDTGPLIRQPTPTQVLDALNCNINTLEYLELDFYDWYQPGFEALWGHDETDPKQRYPTFKHFKKLKVLNIEHERLGPPQELPQTLVALTLSHRPDQPCLIDDPLYYPRIEHSYRKLILEEVCPRLRYVKVGRFYPFRYVGARVFDWRHISRNKWLDFVSCTVDFNDTAYSFENDRLENQEGEMMQDNWYCTWWQSWLTDKWPKNLREDLLERLYREAAS